MFLCEIRGYFVSQGEEAAQKPCSKNVLNCCKNLGKSFHFHAGIMRMNYTPPFNWNGDPFGVV